jgi:hypothetical protein
MQTAFVVPRTYRDYALLMKSALQHGVFDMIQEAPPALRQVDLVHASDCAWAPSTAPYDSSSAVLDVLSAAWEETPLAVCSSHPIGTIPSIGSQIAWAKDNLEICGWMQDIKRGAPWVQTQCTNRVTTVRSIASPSRFIDGMKMRLFNRS